MVPHSFLVFSNQLCLLGFYVTFNVVNIAFCFYFVCVTMMVLKGYSTFFGK